ncbi:MAG: hypothetical protein ACNA8H_00815 [Anaerolineales bacterium]
MLSPGKQILPVTLNAGKVGVSVGDGVRLGSGDAVADGVISGSGEDVLVGSGSVDVSDGRTIVSSTVAIGVKSSRSKLFGIWPSQAETRMANISNQILYRIK